MKFFHIGDLHIGKQLYQYNLKEDQQFILNQILEYAREEEPDAVLIAGDVYDRAMPSAEAVGIFDDFLTKLSKLKHKTEILIISGNHDSAERIEFASGILEKHRVHIAGMPPMKKGEFIKKVSLRDDYGKVNFYLFPFIKPGYVRSLLQEEETEKQKEISNFREEKQIFTDNLGNREQEKKLDSDWNNRKEKRETEKNLEYKEMEGEKDNTGFRTLNYDMAVQKMLARENINMKERNVILSHQFYVWGNQEPERSESEIIMVGNIDSVHARSLEKFDYAALGHIHKPSKVGKEWIRYCGSPLSYSVSEAGQQKGIVMVQLREKSTQASIKILPVMPLRKVRKIEGTLSEILKEEKSSDFVSIFLKDEGELFEARQRLLEIFDHILEIRLDNSHIREIYKEDNIELKELNPVEIFKQFYQEILTKEVSSEQEKILLEIIQECEGI